MSVTARDAGRGIAKRREDLEAQAADLRKRLAAIAIGDEDAASDAAKLSNAITQVEAQLTSLSHLELQRKKAAADEDGGPAFTDKQAAEIAAALRNS